MLLLKASFILLSNLLICAMVHADENKAYVQFNAGAVFAPTYVQDYQETYSSSSYSSHYKESFDTGFAASIALGYRLADVFRVEGELLYQANNRDQAHSKSTYYSSYTGETDTYRHSEKLKGTRDRSAFLINSYYDFKNRTAFTPYITGGVGVYYLRLNGIESGIVENNIDFAWQAGAGIHYKLNDRVGFDLKYRYFGGSDATLVNRGDTLFEVGDHQVMAGIRIGF
ncbi:MAG: outer membrane beta-barrel protein [Methylococcaceae bacterium]